MIGVRLGSIGFLFGFVRLDRSGICCYMSTTRTCCQIVTILSEYVTCHMVRVRDREFGISGYIAAGYLRPHGRNGGGEYTILQLSA